MQEIDDFLGIDNNNDMEVDPENNRPIPHGRNNQEGNRARLVAGTGNQQQNVIPNPVHDGNRAGGIVAPGVAGVANQQPNPIPQLINDGNLGLAALNPAAQVEQRQVPPHAHQGNIQNQNPIPLPQGIVMNGNQPNQNLPNAMQAFVPRPGLVPAEVAGVANQQPNPNPQLRNDGNLGVAALNPAAQVEQRQVPPHAHQGNNQNQNPIQLPQGNVMNDNQRNENLPNAMQAFVPRPVVLQNVNANQARRGRNHNARSTPYDPHPARMRRRNYNNLAQLLMSMAKQGAYVPSNHNDHDQDENDAAEIP